MTDEQLQSKGTGERILEISRGLFARFGFDGVSIRQIANEAKVNVAAVNYHFKNKERLYISVIEQSIQDLRQQVASIDLEGYSIEDFAVKLFELFEERHSEISNVFKVILDQPNHFKHACESQEFSGPPGARELFSMFQKEVSSKQTSVREITWAVRVIITYSFHQAMMIEHIKDMDNIDAAYKPKYKEVRSDVRRLAKTLLQELKSKSS